MSVIVPLQSGGTEENLKKTLVILSGGQDSTTCLFWAIDRYGREQVEAIGFDYGQKHKNELKCAENICEEQGIKFKILPLPLLNEITSNSLTRSNIEVDTKKAADALPNSFVDGRNLLFLSYGAIYAKSKGMNTLVTGVCETDFSGYPDCRDVFIKSLDVTLNLAMDYKFIIETPLMWLNKAEVWQMADDLGVLDIIYNQTLTCYNGQMGGCGVCPACALRQKGYEAFLRMKGEDDV